MNAPRRQLAALSLLAIACQSRTPASSASERSAPQAVPAPSERAAAKAAVPDVPPTPGVQSDGSIVFAVQWFEGSLEQALGEATRQNKQVLAKVGAYWCPPCQRLDEEVFVDPEVAARIHARYVPVYLDADVDEGAGVVAEYHVQAYPTMLVLEPSGVERGRIVDFVDKQALFTALDRIEAGHDVLADLERAVAANPDDIEARYALGHAHALAARRDEAEKAFEVVLLADPKDAMGLASAVAYDRATFFTYKLEGDLERAIAQLRTLERRFPDSEAASKAKRTIARLQHALGRSDEAITTLDAMLARAPESRDLAASYGWFSFRERCKPERGLEVVEAALAREPEDAELLYLKAELAQLLGRHADAKQSIERAAELEPTSMFYRRQVRRFDEANG